MSLDVAGDGALAPGPKLGMAVPTSEISESADLTSRRLSARDSARARCDSDESRLLWHGGRLLVLVYPLPGPRRLETWDSSCGAVCQVTS